MNEHITVKNAGVVLLSNYIPLLFERLGLVNQNKFISSETQINAIQYLQYVVTGLSETEETYLSLNKVICGLPITHAIPYKIDVAEQNKGLVEGLIKAVIGYWPAVGDSSINGFRGNWLIRDGSLVELADRWELTVEKRAYDILLNSSPVSFSIIRHPWMEKPLHTTWSY